PQRTLRPSNGPVPVLVWVGTSTNFRALGLISTRTSNQSEHLHFRHGQFRKTGEKEFGPGKTATAMASTQMAQMAAVIALRSRMEHKLVQALIRARMIWITEFSLLERAVGPTLYRSVLREHGDVEQPKLIRNVSTKRRVLEILESAAPGFDRLSAARKRVDPKTLEILLAKLQAPPLADIEDMKTLRNVVFGL